MTIPSVLLNSLAFIGLISFTYYLQHAISMFIFYLKNKEFPSSLEEEKVKLLKSEIESLKAKVNLLEEENNEITKAIIKRLQ